MSCDALLTRGLEVKGAGRNGSEPLHGRSVALLFEKPSTRTRVSFQVGIQQMGGHAMLMRSEELQLARGESVRDTALVLSRYVDAIVVRHGEHAVVEELARYAGIPVVNALTPIHHPCQALADLLTLRERFGTLEGLRVAYVGDGNNVCQSLMLVGARAGVQVVAATPADLRPDAALVAEAGEAASVVDDPVEAATGAHAIYTDVWVSMGDEQDASRRRDAARAVPARRRAALPRARRRRRDALPAGARGRGDHRGHALRRALRGVGPGREPAARPEGADGAPARRLTFPIRPSYNAGNGSPRG